MPQWKHTIGLGDAQIVPLSLRAVNRCRPVLTLFLHSSGVDLLITPSNFLAHAVFREGSGDALLLGTLTSAAVATPTAPPATPTAERPVEPPVTPEGHVPGPVHPDTSRNFEVVGHDPLFARGMNAAPAVYGDYVYVGNRTDGSEGHPRPGVLVVDAADPTSPRVVGEIGPPNAGNIGETTRELRVWPEQKLLMVLGFTCSTAIHECADVRVTQTMKFYDLTDPAKPSLVSVYVPSRTPHEFYLWVDPNEDGRALLYMSTPTSDLELPNLIVTDISGAREGRFTELVQENANALFPEDVRETNDVALHSMSVNYSGTRLHLAYLGGGYLIADSSDLARGHQPEDPADHPSLTPRALRQPRCALRGEGARPPLRGDHRGGLRRLPRRADRRRRARMSLGLDEDRRHPRPQAA